MSAIGATTAAAAAEAARLRMQAEEETMTPYSPSDLSEGWEFKILRSANGKFKDLVWLHTVLAEEARAGWTLLEKFDNTRVRLKRPASARSRDSVLNFDPYRTWVGISQLRYTLIILAIVFGSIAIVVLIAGLATHSI